MTADPRLEKLLAALPDVAKAVNAFSSEAAQLRVLDALLSAASGAPAPISKGAAPENSEDTRAAPSRPKGSGGKKDPDPKLIPTLNLRPAGKTSLRDFVEQKAPSTNEELYAVIVYYLEHELGTKTIAVDHVFTALKELKRKVSPRLRTVLSNSASRQGWINAANKEDLRTTVNGQNLVEHDLPAKKAK